MAFMQPEITAKQLWYEVDGPCGTEYVPAFLLATDHPPKPAETVENMSDIAYWNIGVWKHLEEYCKNRQYWEINLIEGYGARLSAPGYMDCTEWSVYDTAEKAQEYLDTYYTDDEQED